jgi:hypothetical protein
VTGKTGYKCRVGHKWYQKRNISIAPFYCSYCVPSLSTSVRAWRIASGEHLQSRCVCPKTDIICKDYTVQQYLLNASSVTMRGADCRLYGKTRRLVPSMRLAQYLDRRGCGGLCGELKCIVL